MSLRLNINCHNLEIFLLNEFVSVYFITIEVRRYIINFPRLVGEVKNTNQVKMPTGKMSERKTESAKFNKN